MADAFEPPAVWDAANSGCDIDCNATPPVLCVAVTRKVFSVYLADMMIQLSMKTFQYHRAIGMTILEDMGMKDLVAVLRVGACIMWVTVRRFYSIPW